jgi:hypothetical protein
MSHLHPCHRFVKEIGANAEFVNLDVKEREHKAPDYLQARLLQRKKSSKQPAPASQTFDVRVCR